MVSSLVQAKWFILGCIIATPPADIAWVLVRTTRRTAPVLCAGILAAILGEVVGFWIGRRFGHQLLMRYGARLGFTEGRIRIGQWLFVRYRGRVGFIGVFLPFFLR